MADALYTFRAAFQVVVQPLEILSQDEGATYALSSSLILLQYCFIYNRACPFKHTCLVNYAAMKNRRCPRGIPRSKSRDKYHEN